ILVNVSGAPVLWRVGEDGFQRSSLVEGTIMWFQQASDGLVVSDHSLPLGHNYFLTYLSTDLKLAGDTPPEILQLCLRRWCLWGARSREIGGEGVLRVGAPSGSEVTLRLNLTVKASSCVEPGSRFSDPQCSGKGKCITQPSVSTFFCECENGYSGIFCEEFDACHLRPCQNYAICSDLRQGDEGRNFTCICPPGNYCVCVCVSVCTCVCACITGGC
ncbi:unnamed protein product, partial [Coregonus sp. 'balchen']